MKKTLLFLVCIIGILTSCSQDTDLSSGMTDNNAKSQKIRWYGVKNLDESITTRGVIDSDKLWNPFGGITIKFLNSPSDKSKIEDVKKIAREWEQYAGIKFNFVEATQKASVRIAFDWKGNDLLTWSYTGNDARFIKNQSEPTAVIGGLEYLEEEDFRGDVLRLFGQILGLEYEQRHQDWTYWRSESALELYWKDFFGDIDMSWDELREYVFTPLTKEYGVSPYQTPEIDTKSIMVWPYYTRKETTKLILNKELSEGDKLFIATLYPKNGQDKTPETPVTKATIQEAWLDAGYFTWVDETKTRLRLTELGAAQDTLPDVSDGEQLTSIASMFLHPKDTPTWKYDVKLRKAPKFNTSNITDFSNMFKRCLNLTHIPNLDTSKGTNFSGMFSSCHSLRIVPNLDTSKGINFSNMFSACKLLTIVPNLDTSKGTNFGSMFLGCISITNIPNLDTSKGTNFAYMFYECELLQKKPNINLSKATSTTDMYYGTPFK